MDRFTMNGYEWQVRFVDPGDPTLVDRTGEMRVATTDPDEMCVYVSADLSGEFLCRVLVHELGHAALFSFGLLEDIRRMVLPAYWVEAEEWVCNFIADYGMTIFDSARDILGEDALYVVPPEIERLVA